MKICPECKAENNTDDAQYCNKCGTILAEVNNSPAINNPAIDDDLEFEITETAESDAPQLFGSSSSKDKKDEEESLEIRDNSNLLGDDQIMVPSESEVPTDKLSVDNNISQEPQIPDSPTPDESQQSDQFSVDWSSSPKNEKPTPPQNLNTPKKSETPPSAKDFSKRRSEMDSNKKESSKPIRHVSPKTNNANKLNINEPQTSDSKITKSARVRGIAHFHKNIIQLVGTPFLHENDEIVFKNKPYRLKPYRISKKVRLISMAAVFVLLSIVIGSQIIGPALPGEGQIVGVVLDGNGQPYLSGASIYIPELDKSVTSNAQGFFRFDDIPTGSYELIYNLEDDLEGRENITVTSGSLITRSFGDFRLIEDEIEYSANQAITEQNQPPPTPAKKNTTAKKTKKKKTSGKSKSSGYGKIKLAANIEGAKFVVDGKTLGAGNSTFTKIKSGKRKIQVSKPGYTEYTEIVTVSKNKTKTVKVNLSRKASDTEQPLTANEYFNLGNDAFDSKNYKLAISELNKAIELSPNHVDAYTKRAQSYVAIGENEKASSDYIRVGEIYKFKNQNGLSISQFTSALKYSKNNTTALAGRAGARMAKGEYRSALIDYTTAIDIDSKFYPAHRGAGIAEFKLGDHKNAEKHLKKAKKLNKSDPQLYHYLMLNYLARDNIKQVKKSYAQFKNVAGSGELAEFKSSSKFAPIVRLIDDDDL